MENVHALEEHLYNVRAFGRYMAVDREVIDASPMYNNPPADSGRESQTRKPPTVFSTTTSDDNPKKKSRFLYNMLSDDDSDGDDVGDGDDSGDGNTMMVSADK